MAWREILGEENFIKSSDLDRRLEQDLEVIYRLLREQEKTDLETVCHQYRVARISQFIASGMDLSYLTIKTIKTAALGHDLGKMNVPWEILKRKGPITMAEKRLHIFEGSNLLGTLISASVLEAILQHHESLDGSGYPCKLQGEQVCLEARILKVADEIDAGAFRGSNPSFSKAGRIIKEMRNNPAPYDLQVVEACAKVITNFPLMPFREQQRILPVME